MNKEQPFRKIGFVGMSHLGIVSCVCWASLGWEVISIDSDVKNISSLSRAKLPIHEPQLEDLLKENLLRLEFTTEFSRLAECDLVFVSLDTETDEANQSVLVKLEQLIEQMLPWLGDGVSVVLMSQVPVGFTRQLRRDIQSRRPDFKFDLFYWVETLVIGNAVERLLRPERIILGCESSFQAENSLLDMFAETFSCPLFKMSYESAELTKASINFYLSVSVTFANVLAELCEVTGASMKEIAPALRLDRRIGQYAYIRPGLGIAGGNLERDLVHLQKLGASLGLDTGLLDYILLHNGKRYHWIHRQLDKYVFTLPTFPKIAIWGLAYKKNTQSTKNSFAIRILRELSGKADLCAYDPVAPLPADLIKSVKCFDHFEVLDDVDCLLVLTDWDEFADIDYHAVANRMRNRVIIDCVGVLDREKAVKTGFRYITIGESYE